MRIAAHLRRFLGLPSGKRHSQLSHKLKSREQQHFLKEWWTIAIAVSLLLILMIASRLTVRLDHAFYDELLRTLPPHTSSDIVIIAIDHTSLIELGRWPWPRETHARLLQRLAATSSPKAVGLDLLLTETEQGSNGDNLLAEAMRKLPVIVPMVPEGLPRLDEAPRVLMPVQPIAAAARDIAHINLNLDFDSLVRSIYLKESNGIQWWPALAWAMYLIGENLPAHTELPKHSRDKALKFHHHEWLRKGLVLIPFAGPSGSYPTVSYASVLRGEVPANLFDGKYVFIGATAPGIGDSYATPLSADESTMPGVEIHANVLNSLLHNLSIRPVQPFWIGLISSVLLLIVLIGFIFLSPRASLLFTVSIAVMVLASCVVLLRWQYLWFPPASLLIVIAISYPLWGWRRLEAAVFYLGEEIARLNKEPRPLPLPDVQVKTGDLLQQRIEAMRDAIQGIRDLRQFVSDVIDHLPDATLVSDRNGVILLANQIANDRFAVPPECTLEGLSFAVVLQRLTIVGFVGDPSSVSNQLDGKLLENGEEGAKLREAGLGLRDGQGRDLLLKLAAAADARGELIGWIISLIDVTVVREAERQREEMLRFVTHDMRAPQASIVTLLDLHKNNPSASTDEALLNTIERHVRHTLALTEDFVMIGRAEARHYRFETVAFQDLLTDAADTLWAQAKVKNIQIFQADETNENDLVEVDRGLMTRVLINLLNNAIKYSHANTLIHCRTWIDTTNPDLPWLACSITDQGLGISEKDQSRMFRRFERFHTSQQPHTEGLGLGLAFVKTVIERHHGLIQCQSQLGKGTIFTIRIPIARHL